MSETRTALPQASRSGASRFLAPNYAAAILALAFLALHLPFLPASLDDLDSINFALGIRDFDVGQHQPHPPGYPVFIVAAKAVHLFVPSEVRALSLVGILAGSLAVFALIALFRAIDPGRAPDWSTLATLLTITSPLYWFTAARPLSDTAGLAAALAVQALVLTTPSTAGLTAAGFLSGFAMGLRSQVFWLTVPLLLVTIARGRAGQRWPAMLRASAAFTLGALIWIVPLLLVSGGPSAYWGALAFQGSADLTGVRMLWTTPSPRQFLLALTDTFIAPWTTAPAALVVLLLASAGAVRLLLRARSPLVTLAVAFGPYLVFDLLFQETATTRYSVPLVVPIAYLAVRGVDALPAALARRSTLIVVLLALFNALTVGPAVYWYSRLEAPAFRMLGDMRALTSRPGKPPLAPVLAMHRREHFDMRRPIVWLGSQMPRLSARLAAPPKHEWLEVVKYWNSGGKDDVWFVADPLRTDLALIDRERFRIGSYRWPLGHHTLVGGVRPDIMDWYVIRQPGWYLGDGWSLTPETAGVAKEDGRGPGRAPIEGWIRRRTDAMTLMVGGRNLSPGGPAAHVRIAIDGRTIDEPAVAPGFFLRLLHLPAGALAGDGAYGAITVSADANIAIEQFDAQSSDRVVFGFGDGWHEHEYNPVTGLQWRWMSDRAVLRVRAAGRPLTMTLRGEPPLAYFWKPAHIRISAGGRVVAEETLWNRFNVQARVHAELLTGEESSITIETDQSYVPAEGIRPSPDQRRLGLRVFECDLRPALP